MEPANESIYNQYTLRVPTRRDALQGASDGAGHRDVGVLSAAAAPAAVLRLPRATGRAQCPESERAASEVLSLPIFPELTTAQLDEVIGAVRAFYGR